MSKFTFIRENGYDKSKVTMEFEATSLGDVLDEFETFVRACGYNEEGHLDFTTNTFPEFVGAEPDFSNLPQNNWPFAKTITPGVCSICKISNETMEHHKCYDAQCPKGNTDANQG
jgi:hypothetical protein